MGLGSVGVGTSEQHQDVGAATEGAPGLHPVDHPTVGAAGARGGRGGDLQAGDVTAVVGFGDGHGRHHLGGRQLGQPVLLLLLGAAVHECTSEDLGPRDERAADAERPAAQLLGGHDHADVLAVATFAVAAVLGRHAEAEDAHLGQAADDLLRDVLVVPVHVFGARLDLVLGERTERVLHHLELAVEVTRPGGVGQRGDERRVAVGGEKRVSITQRCHVDAPERLTPGEAGDQVVGHVGGERAGDLRLGVALRAVVEQGLGRGHLRRGVSEVVGEGLLPVGATVGSQVADGSADHALGEFDDVGGCVEIGCGHEPQRSEGAHAAPQPSGMSLHQSHPVGDRERRCIGCVGV